MPFCNNRINVDKRGNGPQIFWQKGSRGFEINFSEMNRQIQVNNITNFVA
jgi:hypothetical protein